jgi:hypothetical protein
MIRREFIFDNWEWGGRERLLNLNAIKNRMEGGCPGRGYFHTWPPLIS